MLRQILVAGNASGGSFEKNNSLAMLKRRVVVAKSSSEVTRSPKLGIR